MTRSVLTLAAALFLAACGFQPLYNSGEGSRIDDIAIGTIAADPSLARLVDLELERALEPSSDEGRPYRVDLALTDRRRAVAVSSGSATTRFDYFVSGTYSLVDSATNEPVYEQKVQAVASYGVVSSQYATLVAREDAMRRAAVELVRRMKVDLALYLAEHPRARDTVTLPDVLEEDGRLGGGALSPR